MIGDKRATPRGHAAGSTCRRTALINDLAGVVSNIARNTDDA